MAAAAPPGGKRKAPATWKWVGLAALAWLLLAFPYFEATRNANELPRLAQAMAVMDGGTFAVDGPERRDLELGPDLARSADTGRLYPNKPPGTSLAIVPAYFVARQLFGDDLTLRQYTYAARFLVGIVPTLLLVVVLFRRYAPSYGVAITGGAVALYLAGTTAASYAHVAFGHQLAACLLALGVVLLVDATESIRYDLAILGGLAAGSAVAVEYGAVFAALPIGLMLVFGYSREGGGAVTASALGGALFPVIGLAIYHKAAFGSPWTTGYHAVINPTFAAKHGEGVLGLSWPTLEGLHRTLTAADGGLLWWTPAIVVAVIGLIRAATRVGAYRAEAKLWLTLIVLYVVIASSLSFEGGWRVGPRYVVAVLPGAILGFASALAWASERPLLQPLFIAVGIYSIVANVLAASLWPHMDVSNVNQPLAEVLLPLWQEGAEPYGVPWLVGVGGAATLSVVVAALGWLGIMARAWAWEPRDGALGGVGLALGGVLVWATTTVEPHPRGSANLRYIQRVWEPPAEGATPTSFRLPASPGFRAIMDPSRPVIPEPPRRPRRRRRGS